MQAVVLAGGLGTRLRPVTYTKPKCMVPVGGKPFLSYLLDLCKAGGVTDVILCTGYLGEHVETYFGNGKAIGLELRYGRETEGLLGTGGALKLAEPMLAESFLVINGDTYLDIDYEAVYSDFMSNPVLGLIVAGAPSGTTNCDLKVDGDSMITAYDKTDPGHMDYVNAGVMALRKETLSTLIRGRSTSLERDIFPALVNRHQVKAYFTTQPFYDIGSFAGLSIFGKTFKTVSV